MANKVSHITYHSSPKCVKAYNEGENSGISYICAHAPMSPRARTSAPDERWSTEVQQKGMDLEYLDADWIFWNGLNLIVVVCDSCSPTRVL